MRVFTQLTIVTVNARTDADVAVVEQQDVAVVELQDVAVVEQQDVAVVEQQDVAVVEQQNVTVADVASVDVVTQGCYVAPLASGWPRTLCAPQNTSCQHISPPRHRRLDARLCPASGWQSHEALRS